MSAFEVEQPILNSPFEEPAEHWQIEEGQRAEAARRPPARPATSTATRKAPQPEPGQAARGEWQELELVNLIRERLAQWRAAGYPGATRTTLDLLQHWRRDGREQRLFFAQLEAAETIIFLNEARSDLLQGVDVPPEVVPEGVEAFTALRLQDGDRVGQDDGDGDALPPGASSTRSRRAATRGSRTSCSSSART